MLRNDDMYEQISSPYEQLISKEDRFRNINRFFDESIDCAGKEILDLGAGTGRLACMLAPKAKSVIAMDFAAEMLKVAAEKLTRMRLDNWKTTVADLKAKLPVEDQSADIVTAGWAICYLGSTNRPDWRENLQNLFGEIKRVLRPGGKLVIFETLGTGFDEPNPPDFLTSYFEWLQQELHVEKKILQTDFSFDRVEQAAQLCGDFFGDGLGEKIRQSNSTVVPSWTGVWFGGLR